MSYSGIGDGLVIWFWIAFASIPLALWKIIEILIWFFSHLEWK